MRLLRRLVIVLALLWLGAELAAAPVAQHVIEQQVAQRTSGAATVRAHVTSFPIVSRVLLTSRITKVTLTLDRITRSRLTFSEVSFELDGIEVDRAAMFQRKFRMTAIDQGTVTATIDLSTLPPELAKIVSGQAGVVAVSAKQVASDLFPCDPQGRVEGGRVIVSCTIHQVPKALLEAAQRG